MSNKKKNSLYHSRKALTGMGSSHIELFEVENPGQMQTFNVGKNTVRIKPFYVESMPNLKPYVFIEKYDSLDLTTIDILYGKIDIQALKKDSDLRKRLFETMLTRENVETITRKYCGLIPQSLTTDPYGKIHFNYDKSTVIALARSMSKSAYVENRQTSIRMNNSGGKGYSFSDLEGAPKKQGKRKGFFDRIFGGTGKGDNSTSSSQLGRYQGTTTYTKNEGIIFYRSGVVILGDSQFLKYNYATKDSETGLQTELNSFLVGSLDEDRLRWDDTYRRNFVNEVLSPSRLKNARTVPMFPYIGEFTDSGHFQNNIDNFLEFNKIVEEYRQ